MKWRVTHRRMPEKQRQRWREGWKKRREEK